VVDFQLHAASFSANSIAAVFFSEQHWRRGNKVHVYEPLKASLMEQLMVLNCGWKHCCNARTVHRWRKWAFSGWGVSLCWAAAVPVDPLLIEADEVKHRQVLGPHRAVCLSPVALYTTDRCNIVISYVVIISTQHHWSMSEYRFNISGHPHHVKIRQLKPRNVNFSFIFLFQ